MNPIYKSLYVSMGDPEEAFLRDPSHTEQEYRDAADSLEYEQFLQDINTRFVAHLDQMLIYQQYEAFKMLEDVKKGTIDMRYLKDISAHYHNTLKLTTPIVERLGTQIRQEELLTGLRLVITPTQPTE